MKLFPKNVFISGLALFWLTNLFAQAPDTLWTRTYGGEDNDKGHSVQQTTDGGYIIAGETFSFGNGSADIWLLKTDANGDTVWTKTYGGDTLDIGYSIQLTSDSGYIIVGETSSFGAGMSDIWLLKIGVNGDTIWTKTYGGIAGDVGYSVQQTLDGGYIIVGVTSSFGASGTDIWLLKTDANGDTSWTKRYGGRNDDRGYSVQQTLDSGYIIAGETRSFGIGENDIWLLKTDALGDTVWTKTYGCPLWDGGRSVQQTTDGGYIIAGRTTQQECGFCHLIKTDVNGNNSWASTFGHHGYAYAVQQTVDNGYITTGIWEGFFVLLAKLGANGDYIWETWYEYGVGRSVQQTSDGGFIIAGYTELVPNHDVYLIKIATDPGIEEEKIIPITDYYGATIFSGPLLLPEGKKCKVFDITGRTIAPDKIKPGIYFIEVDGEIVNKVIKVR